MTLIELDQEACTLCPRLCGAIRGEEAGAGVCGMPRLPTLARAALHHWEEPCLSGQRGAGTVFFSGCSLRCIYCQNEGISHGNFGAVISIEALQEVFLRLIAQGAHTIDLVNPTHFAWAIGKALDRPLSVPVVWNSSGYERIETLQALEGKVQVYLPDLKYPDEEGALRYSGVSNYPALAKAAIVEMQRQTGPYVLDEEGILQRGVLIRHLLLPGRLQQAKEVMDWVSETFPPGSVLVSLMGQYLPFGRAKETPPLNRTIRSSELRAAIAYMEALGLSGYTQDSSSAKEEYVPNFDLSGL